MSCTVTVTLFPKYLVYMIIDNIDSWTILEKCYLTNEIGTDRALGFLINEMCVLNIHDMHNLFPFGYVEEAKEALT